VNALSEIAGFEGQHCDRGQHPTAGRTGGLYGAGGKLWLATTPDSVLQAATTDQAVPALHLNIICIALYEVILLMSTLEVN
jgi:hypothetical protein